MPLLSAPYDAVRAVLDVSLTLQALSDAAIGLDPFAPAAERWVLARVPNAGSLSGEALERAKAAATYETAARLAPALPNITAESVEDLRVQRQARDAARQAADLHARAEAEVAALTAADETVAQRPSFFALASGRRGR